MRKIKKGNGPKIEIFETLGFRDKATGRIVRLHTESNSGRGSFCGEETCRLSLDPQYPFFELKTMKDIASVLKYDENWYNSSKDRPMWDGQDPKNFEIISLKRTETYDGPDGSDPIEEKLTIESAPFPGYIEGEALKARRLPSALIRRYFDANLSADEVAWSEVSLIAFDERPDADDVRGKFISPSSMGNTGIVEALVELPEDYLVEGAAKSRLEEGKVVMIALVNLSDYRFDLSNASAPRP